VTPSFSVRDVATRDDSYFRLKMGVLAPGGELTPDRFRVLVGNGGDELIALQYEVIDAQATGKRSWRGFGSARTIPRSILRSKPPQAVTASTTSAFTRATSARDRRLLSRSAATTASRKVTSISRTIFRG